MDLNARRFAFTSHALIAFSLFGAVSDASAASPSRDAFLTRCALLHESLSGQRTRFELSGTVTAPIDEKRQSVAFRLARFDRASFDLDLIHDEYALRIRRRSNATAFALPKHKVVFLGRGDVEAQDTLSPDGALKRFFTSSTVVGPFLPAIEQSNPRLVVGLLESLLGLTFDETTGEGSIGDVRIRLGDANQVQVTQDDIRVEFSLVKEPPVAAPADHWPAMRSVSLPRAELERQLSRGGRRTLELLMPSQQHLNPPQRPRKVANGELKWIDGQRVVLLHGTPEQIGTAHGELVRKEAIACIDSVLHAFGTVQTIRTGRWFRHDLEAAYKRLSPHIPARHKDETRALAEALGIENSIAQTLNVFPELFHCSGFALFDSATADGKLYHGRVLDYMTTIGLQDAAVTFIVAVDGRIPFANVGYAGFIGSVSGMNAEQISLGEMGGRGEGQWDGVPMATLMRRALEECRTLEEVCDLWKRSPRTCEYYYVFADGRARSAVGVAATPDSIEFIQPGEAHPKLGEGIPDAVVLSAGQRLATLRQRVQDNHGKFDASMGQWLMSRPVAMQSNLHNVLFVPEDGVFYVANADHERPAAERPYVRFDLRELLSTMPAAVADVPAATRP